MSVAYFIGVDGGGTGCRARIENVDGEVLGHGMAGPATLRLGPDGAWASVMKAVNAAMAEAGLTEQDASTVAVGVALAGLGRKGTKDALSKMRHSFARLELTNDGHGAFLGAHSGKDGAIVIAGTGSVGLGFVEGRALRVGGYGFPISDEGSGAFLGLCAIQFALRAQDGRRPSTALLKEVMERFKNDPFETVQWMDAATASTYATFAPTVLRHADQGDPAAREIVQAAAEHIDTFVRTLIAQGAPRVSLLGGLSSVLIHWLAPDVRRLIRPADGDAVSGAITLVKQAIAQAG